MPKDSSVQGKVNGTYGQKQTTFYAESVSDKKESSAHLIKC